MNLKQPQSISCITTPLINHVNLKTGKLGGTFCHFISEHKCSNILQEKEFGICKVFKKHKFLVIPLSEWDCYIFDFLMEFRYCKQMFLKRYLP